LNFTISIRREVFEDLGEAEAALEATLPMRADLGVERNDARVEGVGALHRLGLLADFLVVDRSVFDERIEALEIGSGDVTQRVFIVSGVITGATILTKRLVSSSCCQ
jgi:hypothetical protein